MRRDADAAVEPRRLRGGVDCPGLPPGTRLYFRGEAVPPGLKSLHGLEKRPVPDPRDASPGMCEQSGVMVIERVRAGRRIG